MRVYKTTKSDLDKVLLSGLPPGTKQKKFDEFDDGEKIHKMIAKELEADASVVIIVRGTAGCEMIWRDSEGVYRDACFPQENDTFSTLESYKYLNKFETVYDAIECAIMDAYTS